MTPGWYLLPAMGASLAVLLALWSVSPWLAAAWWAGAVLAALGLAVAA